MTIQSGIKMQATITIDTKQITNTIIWSLSTFMQKKIVSQM